MPSLFKPRRFICLFALLPLSCVFEPPPPGGWEGTDEQGEGDEDSIGDESEEEESGGSSGSEGDDASSDGTIGTAGPCAGEDVCIPVAPPGWTGPVYRFEGVSNNQVSCPEGTSKTTVTQGLKWEEASCGCDCNPPTADCGFPSLVHYSDTDSLCSQTPLDSVSFENNTCTYLQKKPSGYFDIKYLNETNGKCLPVTHQELPERQWDTWVNLCLGPEVSPEEALECETSKICAREFEGQAEYGHCIWRNGAHSCPVNYSDFEKIYHTDVIDTRGCTACSCENPEANCDSKLKLLTGCSGSIMDEVASHDDFSCVKEDRYFSHLLVTSPAVTGRCDPEGGEPFGEVKEANPVTVCCI